MRSMVLVDLEIDSRSNWTIWSWFRREFKGDVGLGRSLRGQYGNNKGLGSIYK